MNRYEISNAYFQSLYDWACGDRYHKDISYRKLLMHLHNTEFIFQLAKDENRASDGVDLRYHFARTADLDEPFEFIMECLDGPCSVLEMMIALAIRCERDYMDDPLYGDRSTQWFWEMVVNLNLGSMVDTRYDKHYVDKVLFDFLHRKYERDGRGGLFRVRNYDGDMRKLEIWHQMCYFLDTLV